MSVYIRVYIYSRWPLGVFRRFVFLFCHVGEKRRAAETVYLYWLDACFISFSALISVTQLRDTWRALFPTMTQHRATFLPSFFSSFQTNVRYRYQSSGNSAANPRERERRFLNRSAPSAQDVSTSFSHVVLARAANISNYGTNAAKLFVSEVSWLINSQIRGGSGGNFNH